MSTIKAENAPHGATLTTTTTALAASASASASAGSPFSASIGGLSGLSGSGIAFQLPTNLSINGASAAAAIGGATTATTSGSATTTTTRNNVSVTNIKCEADDLRMCTSSPPAMGANGVTSTSTSTSTTPLNGNLVPVIASTNAGLGIGFSFNGVHHGGGCGIRIPVPKAEEDSDSEAELTNIENLKVTRRASAGGGGGGGGGIAGSSSCASALNKNGPRPMSWEGELSEPETTETDLMETENSVSNDRPYLSAGAGDVAGLGGGLTVIKSEATTTAATPATATAPPAHHVVKHELDPISVEVLHASGLMSPYGPAAAAAATGAKVKLGQQLSQPQSDPINLKYEPGLEGGGTNGSAAASAAGLNSPLLARNKSNNSMLPANPSPDSAIHSVYTHSSPSQSPLTSRHAPYTPSLSRNNSDASHSSCYSYSSEFSPTHSPIQGRHSAAAAQAAAAAAAAAVAYGSFNASLHHHSVLYRPISLDSGGSGGGGGSNGALAPLNGEAHNLSSSAPGGRGGRSLPEDMHLDGGGGGGGGGASAGSDAIPSPGISRQQLINSPCPICGDKISGFHYGIFSCESCKGFFKRTVQNRKNYVCVRGGPCPVSISTRKKCPACRFEKCLQKGMKLEAIREDRTRGGRSTYQCSYTLPNSMLSPLLSPADHLQQAAGAPSAATAAGAASSGGQPQTQTQTQQQQQQQAQQHRVALAQAGGGGANGYVTIKTEQGEHAGLNGSAGRIPVLLQEIMDVEHLWQYNEAELARLNQPLTASHSATSSSASSPGSHASSSSSNQIAANPLLASAGLASNGENANPDLIAHLCNVADHRLYKIVKWCKSLPLFKNISIDDQICLLINSWCELLLFSCCFRSIDTPGEIKMSQGKKISLAQAKSSGLQACIERMLNLTDHLRRLRVDRYEYVAMKVIVLLQSDTSELQEPVKVRECQEKALQSLQAYTLAHYPDAPSKFGELLLRIPDLQRTCQLGKEMLTIKSRDGGDFNLLMELLRGEH